MASNYGQYGDVNGQCTFFYMSHVRALSQRCEVCDNYSFFLFKLAGSINRRPRRAPNAAAFHRALGLTTTGGARSLPAKRSHRRHLSFHPAPHNREQCISGVWHRK